MEVSVEGKKVVVWDDGRSRQNENYDRSRVKTKWWQYSGLYLYEECLKKDIQIITPDIYFALEKKPKAIVVYDRLDVDMSTSFALRDAGAKLAIVVCSEQPLYACRFYWNLPKITSYFDYSEVMRGVKDWVSPNSKLRPWYVPHSCYKIIHEVPSNFQEKNFLVMINSNMRVHWLRRIYVAFWNFIKPMPNFENREGYKSRLEAIQYFSKDSDFDLYGYNWDKPVRYTHKYDKAIRKSYRGSPIDKFETLRKYKFSISFDNAYLGGLVQYLVDSLYTGAVPIYWGAPDVAELVPENCFIDFRKFDCDFSKLDAYLRSMDETEYNKYIKNINAWIASPAAYKLSQEHYVGDLIKLFESYF